MVVRSRQVVAGQTAALALKRVKRSQVRKGMVLVDEKLKPKASWEFDADIAILTHSTTIQPRYQVHGCSMHSSAPGPAALDCGGFGKGFIRLCIGSSRVVIAWDTPPTCSD